MAMGLALYRKYRSKSLDEIVGQTHITDILQHAIKSGNIAHAYLLTGPRGVGKTSIARILAHEINGLPYTDESSHLDIIEIDAASNNSVEDIRDLRERVQIAPTSAAKKVYIIDEVHMLSKSAFNALLKTLEEPPEHVVFILATTDVEKLPATIISRTQRFNFRAISTEDAVSHLADIAAREHITIDKDALELIAEHSLGSFRDSISMLDQLHSGTDGAITQSAVEEMMGLASRDTIDTLLHAYQMHDIATIVTTLAQYERRGTPASTIVRQLIGEINTRILTQPGLLTLLDALLDTSKTAWPYMKLLTALAANTTAPQSTERPAEPPANDPLPEPIDDSPSSDQPTAQAEPAKKVKRKEEALTHGTPEDTPSVSASPFDWDVFVAHVKDKASGAYVLLTKCGYTFDGTTLTIYAGKKFSKDQLEKSLSLLNEALAHTAPGSKEVTVLARTKPSENSQTAAVLDIMGGGEEVSI